MDNLCSFESGLLNRYLSKQHSNKINNSYFNKLVESENSKFENKSSKISNQDKLKGGYININKEQLVSIFKNFHDNSKTDLINSIKNELKNGYDKPQLNFEINEDEIDKFLFDDLMKTLHLNKYNVDLKIYNIVHQDIETEESFNEISEHLLEENSNKELETDMSLNLYTIEEIYDKYIVYNSPKREIYDEYKCKILNQVEEYFDKDFYSKVKKIFALK